MKFSNWVNKKNNSSLDLLERILLDMSVLSENEEDIEEIENMQDIDVSPFSDDEDAKPRFDNSEEVKKEEKQKKLRKIRLVKETKNSMLNLRYKAMQIRKFRINRLRKIGQGHPDTDRILKKLGYNVSRPDAYQAAISEQGNDYPEEKNVLLRSKSLNEFRSEFMSNLASLYELYSYQNPSLYTDEKLSDATVKIMGVLTKRRVSKNNKPSDWTSTNSSTDQDVSSIIRLINSIAKNTQTDEFRRSSKEKVFGAARDEREDYADAIKGAAAKTQSSDTMDPHFIEEIRKALESLETRDKKQVLTFLLLYGLDDMANHYNATGKIVVPDDVTISMVYKINKSGTVSDKVLDFPAVVEKLQRNYGINATVANIPGWKNRILTFLKEKLQPVKDAIEREKMESFSNWFKARLLKEI